MISRRTAFCSTIVAVVIVSALGASAAEVTTFSFASAGCSGGGDHCGAFPLVRTGSATYSHSAGADGAISLTVEAEGGLPVDVCLPGRPCEPITRYHGEAVGNVWADISIPGGTTTDEIRAEFDIDELAADAEAIVGGASATLGGTITIARTPGQLGVKCSDGSAVIGSAMRVLDETTSVGNDTLTAAVSCAGTGNLPATSWRVTMQLQVDATADGGSATATADARLVRLTTQH